MQIRNDDLRQRNWAARLVSVLQVAPGLFQIRLPMVNAWLIAEGTEAVLIDSGTWRNRGAIDAALAIAGASRIHTVLLTHSHVDHAGCAAGYQRDHAAQLVCHGSEAPFLEGKKHYDATARPSTPVSNLLFGLGERWFAVPKCSPDLVVHDGSVLETPVGTVRAVFTPGHTPGHTAWLFESRQWLFTGDAVIVSFPYRRFRGVHHTSPIFCSDMEGARRSAALMCNYKFHSLLSGHGPAIIGDADAELRAMLSAR